MIKFSLVLIPLTDNFQIQIQWSLNKLLMQSDVWVVKLVYIYQAASKDELRALERFNELNPTECKNIPIFCSIWTFWYYSDDKKQWSSMQCQI